MRGKNSNIELYLTVKARDIFKELHIDEYRFINEIDQLIENVNRESVITKEIAENIIEHVFVFLYKESYIKQIRFPIIDSKNLPLKERLQIQEYIEDMNNDDNGASDNSTPNYTPFDTFYRLFHEFINKDKIEYAFSYLLERNLVSGEREILDNFYQICSDQAQIPIIDHIMRGTVTTQNEARKIELCVQIDIYEYTFQNYNNKEKSGGLYDKLLDTMLPEIIWFCLKHIILYASNETVTYNELIRECVNNNSSYFNHYIAYQADVLRKLVSDIYENNDEKKYYRRFRRKNLGGKQNTISSYEKDIYKLIYLLHNKRERKSSDCYSKEDVAKYNGLLDSYWEKTFSTKYKMPELAPLYKDYVDYILKDKPIKKTGDLQDSVNGMILLNNIITCHFMQNPEICWSTMTSIFTAPWEFIKTASSVWSEKREHLYNDETLKKPHKQLLFMHYCNKISHMDLPKTQKLLIEDPQFFEVYLNSPYWLDHIMQLARYLSGIAGYYVSYMNGLSEKAFSHKSKELVKIEELLRMTYTTDSSNATPEMIADFLQVYLLNKA